MKRDAWIAPGDSIDDSGNKARGQKGVAPDSHLPRRRVGKKLDVLHTLTQIVEDGRSAIKQCAAIFGWFHPLAVAIE